MNNFCLKKTIKDLDKLVKSMDRYVTLAFCATVYTIPKSLFAKFQMLISPKTRSTAASDHRQLDAAAAAAAFRNRFWQNQLNFGATRDRQCIAMQPAPKATEQQQSKTTTAARYIYATLSTRA